jgi:transcriptional regulator with XRE-family HTH domain
MLRVTLQARIAFSFFRRKILRVPRKNPLNKRELAICARLKAFRTSIRYPRTFFANHAGLDSSTIVRIELGRTALRYDVARRICDLFSVNPGWLANGGDEPMRAWRRMPTSHEIGVDPNALFSKVFDTQLAPRFRKDDDKRPLGLPEGPKTLREHISTLGEDIAIMFLGSQRSDEQYSAGLVEILNNPLPVPAVTMEAARVVAENLHHRLLQKAGKPALPPGATKLSSILEPGKLLHAHYQYVLKKASEESRLDKKRGLTHSEIAATSVDVKAQLPSLLEQLRKATAEPGKKTALAKFLRAPLASVSRWLSGDREPGGETVLQMQAWLKRPTK